MKSNGSLKGGFGSPIMENKAFAQLRFIAKKCFNSMNKGNFSEIDDSKAPTVDEVNELNATLLESAKMEGIQGIK